MRADQLRGVLVAALTSAAVVIGPGIGSAALGSPTSNGSAASGPGSVLWTSVRDGDGHAVAADPRGGMVFVAGSTGLVAYDSGTGAKVWENGAGSGRSVAVSPEGHVVFVIKPIRATGGTWDFSTAAFDTATGKPLWARHYNGRANGDDRPAALAVSPGGSTVFVTGTSQGKTSGRDYATVAYSALTGKQLWASRYNGHGRGADIAVAMTVSPRGGAVFVTGTSSGRNSGSDFATVAYAAATGASLWTKRYDQANRLDAASSVAASPDGRRVFVTGASDGRRFGLDFATVAYAAATGSPLWVRRYHAPADRDDMPVAVLVSPRGGGTVVVSGGSRGNGNNDYVSVGYSTLTGRTRWVSRFHRDFQPEFPEAAAISPDGRSFYLTGSVFPGGGGGEEPADALTVAAKIATGAVSWSNVVTPTSHDAIGRSVAVSPDSGTVYIVLQNFTTVAKDFATVAFKA